MNRFTRPALALAIAGLFACGGSIDGHLGLASAVAQEALRPEVGKPLQAAQDLLKARKYSEALAKVREADAAPNKTANESFTIERMRGAVAQAAGDYDTASKSFEAQINSGKLPAAEQLKLMEALAGTAYRAKDYKKSAVWAQRYLTSGGTNGQIRTLLIQSEYLSGDFAQVNKELQAEFSADEKSGRAPSEERLQMLANAQLRLNDNAGYVATIERLVANYPKKQYWADLISRIRRKPGFSDRLSLDVYRLQLSTGNLTTAADFLEMAQLALQAGDAGEGKTIVEQGFASGALGKGTDAERHGRLKALAEKKVAEARANVAQAEAEANADKTGDALVSLGYSLVGDGQADKGVALIEKGIAKGGLKNPEDAKLHLGLAQAKAGQRAKATQTLRSVRGTDGTADLARLWVLEIGRG